MMIRNIVSRKNRILLAELVRSDFKLRYESSSLGYAWSILNPLLMFAILYIIFSVFLGLGRKIPFYPVYLLVGVVLWRFFTETTNNGLKAIVQRGSLIRKINFPKYIIIVAGTISSLINLFINLIVILIFMIISGVPLAFKNLLIFPLIAELYILALGLAFFLSAVNVRFRDVGYLWEIVVQAGFYATPVIYPLGLVLERSPLAAQILILNPVAQVIQDVRSILITKETLTIGDLFGGDIRVFIPYILVLFVFIAGSLYFKKHSRNFAEYV